MPKETSKDNSAFIIQQIITVAEKNRSNKAIGRYQGWGLIFTGPCHDWINQDYELAKSQLDIKGIKLNRWSSISYDEDDSNEFGVKLTR